MSRLRSPPIMAPDITYFLFFITSALLQLLVYCKFFYITSFVNVAPSNCFGGN